MAPILLGAKARHPRRFLVPEVVQTSGTDCGPATLKCVAEGFGLHLSYGRLREACQTDVDGSSIDAIQDLARRLGLEARQVLLPEDHLLVPEADALPAIVVVRQPVGLPHFVVAWSTLGPWVQVMDPGTGRRWPLRHAFRDELYLHTMRVPASGWRRWAGSEEYLRVLRRRLRQVGVGARAAERLVTRGLRDPAWRSIAALDASARMVASLLGSGGLSAGAAAARLCEALFDGECRRHAGEARGTASPIPATYWPALPVEAVAQAPSSPAPGATAAAESPPDATPDPEPLLLVRGAVVLELRRPRRGSPPAAPARGEPPAAGGGEAAGPAPDQGDGAAAELLAARDEQAGAPAREILRRLREGGLGTPLALALAVTLSAGAALVEAVLLRALLQVGSLPGAAQRAGLVGGAIVFFLALLLIELPIGLGLARLGRRLEVGLRVAFHEKLPRLGARYFRSRPTSDMSERSHSLQILRGLPALGSNLLRAVVHMLVTAAGLVWLFPGGTPLVAALALLGLAVPLAGQRVLAERELRMRSHQGALGRFYLDGLLGLVALRTHGAERGMRREHGTLLDRWLEAGRRFQDALVAVQGVQALVGLGLVVSLLWAYGSAGRDPGGSLLLVYWALNLNVIGQELARLLGQYPLYRNVTLRALEPLFGLEEEGFLASRPGATPAGGAAAEPLAGHASAAAAGGVAIRFEDMSVRLGSRDVLRDVELAIGAGEHVAVVGRSGAGKSTLLGCLLGWNRPHAGRLLVDGAPLDGARLRELRRRTAWADASVRLWNLSLLDNLRYGSGEDAGERVPWAIGQAGLEGVVASLPQGLRTPLGEGGALVSGGEGQRVRVGRAMLREDARLVLLDEPFQGLPRSQRALLLSRARACWRGATLLCVTHDLEDTTGFDRVLVLEDGRVLEAGAPAALREAPNSRYRSLLEDEAATHAQLWSPSGWRRLLLERGRLAGAP